MIVDDQPLIRQGLSSLLSLEDDIELIAEVSSGREAISLCNQLKPDVILMDILMPGFNGVEATREIMARNPGMRVLMLTTFDEDEFILDSLKAGACGYLLKDTSSDDLAAAIRVTHHGHTQLGPTIAPKVLARLKPVAPKQETNVLQFMSEREQEILKLIGQGLSNKEIAASLHITEGTVKNHVSSIFTHLGVRDRTQAALWAKENFS